MTRPKVDAISRFCCYSPEEIPRRIGSTDLVQRFECGQVEPRDFVSQLCRTLDLEIDYDRFCEIWSSIFLRETLIPEAMLEGLSRRGRLLLLHFAAVSRRLVGFRAIAAAARGIHQGLEDLVLHGAPAGVVLLRQAGHRFDRVYAHHALDAIAHLLLLRHEELEALLEIAADEALHRAAIGADHL